MFRRLFLTLAFCASIPIIQASDTDSLRYVIEGMIARGETSEAIDTYFALANELNAAYQHDEAVEVLVSALETAKTISENESQYKILTELGYTYFWKDDYVHALKYLNDAQQLSKSDLSPELISMGLSRLAEVLINLGEFEKALKTQLEVLALSEKESDTVGIANSHRIISRIHWYNQEFAKALSSVKLAQWYFEQLNDEKSIYTCLASEASIYTQLRDLEPAMEASRQSLTIAKNIEYPYGIAFSTGMLGEVYKQQGKYKLAEQKFISAIKGFQQHHIQHETADFMKSLAENYALSGQYELAISTLEEALSLADEIPAILLQKDIYELLSTYYHQQGKDSRAYVYTQKFIYLKDSLYSTESQKRLENVAILYEIDRQSQEIKVIKEQHAASFNKLVAIGLGLGSILLMVIVWLLYGRFRRQQKNTSSLLEQNNEMSLHNQVLLNTNTYLRKMTDSLSQELRVTTRHLKQQADQLNEFRDHVGHHAARRAVREVNAGVSRMDKLLSELLVAAAEIDQPDKLSKINLGELVKEIVQDLPESYRGKGSQIMTQSLPEIVADRDKIRQLFQHLIINAIRFKRDVPAKVKIGSTYSGGTYIFSVQDNGIGFETDDDHLFRQREEPQNRNSVSNERIGLIVCRKIVSQYNGKIWASSEPGKGSTFYFTLPSAIAPEEVQEAWLEEAG